MEDGPEEPNRLTIEQLAGETGMTVRNIRAHQSRSLLPPPDVRARTGYYGPEHVSRLRLIQEMQADGFNLTAIERLLERSESGAEQLLGLKHAITAPFATEEPELVTAEELRERFGDEPRSVDKAIKLGLLVPVGGDRFEAPSPMLLDAAERVMADGVPLPVALRLVEQMKRHCESVARSFVRLFLEEVWAPFEEAGHPEERWPEVVASIERLRPLASQALLAVFQQTMTSEVEEAFGKKLERMARKGR